MSVTVHNETFYIRKGDTFSKSVRVIQNGELLDMTGYTFTMDIRNCIDDTITILELTEANSRIDTSLVAQGIVILYIDSTDTALLEEQKAVYDLQWVDTSSYTRTILQGNVEILETVTR